MYFSQEANDLGTWVFLTPSWIHQFNDAFVPSFELSVGVRDRYRPVAKVLDGSIKIRNASPAVDPGVLLPGRTSRVIALKCTRDPEGDVCKNYIGHWELSPPVLAA
jgi:hypothetical protein